MEKNKGMPKWRHEDKYLCSDQELIIIYHKLKNLVSLDPHVDAGKRNYLVKSVYFDDVYNTAYYDNECGSEPREKWRIRTYNCDARRITLECKRKEYGMISKSSCPLEKGLFLSIMCGKKIEVNKEYNKLLNRFLALRNMVQLNPVIIVQYQRYPFIYKYGNVRITFDCGICSSFGFNKFPNEDKLRRPILSKGTQLLEVKYDEYIPDYLYHTIQLANMQKMTFSKYYLCRRINIGGQCVNKRLV